MTPVQTDIEDWLAAQESRLLYSVRLCRIDADKNMARFYRLAVERDLFGIFEPAASEKRSKPIFTPIGEAIRWRRSGRRVRRSPADTRQIPRTGSRAPRHQSFLGSARRSRPAGHPSR